MIEKRIRPVHRFFFALFSPPVLARQVVEAMVPFADGARMMRPDRLHVTLDILDDVAVWPDAVVTTLIAAGSTVSAASFGVTLDRLSGGAHTIALRPRVRNPALAALHHAIVAARRGLGVEGRHGYAFSPHMTLVYRKGTPFSRTVAPVEWQATEFVLIHSLIGQTRHEVIGRWALCDRPRATDGAQLTLL